MKNDTVKTEYVYVIYGRMCDTCFTPDICIIFEDALKLRREQIVEYCEINELNLPDDIDSSETTITVEGKYAYAEWNIEPVKLQKGYVCVSELSDTESEKAEKGVPQDETE